MMECIVCMVAATACLVTHYSECGHIGFALWLTIFCTFMAGFMLGDRP